jgi:hypothetical protein
MAIAALRAALLESVMASLLTYGYAPSGAAIFRWAAEPHPLIETAIGAKFLEHVLFIQVHADRRTAQGDG